MPKIQIDENAIQWDDDIELSQADERAIQINTESENINVPEGFESYVDVDQQGIPTRRLQKIPAEPTFGQQMEAGVETAKAFGSGMASGIALTPIATLKGVSQALSAGKYGTKEGAMMVEKAINDLVSNYTYQPKTKLGQEYTQNIAETIAPLEGMFPPTAAGSMGSGMRNIRSQSKAQKPFAPTSDDITSAQQHGIDVMRSDTRPPKTPFTNFVQSTGEKIPYAGTGGMRKHQQVTRISAINDLALQFGAHEQDVLTNIMSSLANKRQATLDKFVNLKKDVITRLSSPSNIVPINATSKAIQEQVQSLRQINTKSSLKAASELERYMRSFENKTLQGVEDVRRDLGELFKDPSLASSKSAGEKAVSAIYAAVNEDMGNFIKTNGASKDFNKWKIANKNLSSMFDDLKSTAFKAVLSRGDIKPEELNKLIFSKNTSELKLLFKNIDESGRQHVKTAIINRALEASGGKEHISPAKFLTQINKLQKNIGVFFNKTEQESINGLAKALSITKRADEYAANPPTGQQIAIPIVSGLIFDAVGGSYAASIGVGATIGLATRFYESTGVQTALKRISKAQKGTKDFDLAVESLLMAIYTQQAREQENEPK